MVGRRNDDIPAMLERLRPLAECYADNFLGRHVILEFNSTAFDVHWQKHHFMHLCGLDCIVPQRLYRFGAKPAKCEVFFDGLLSGRCKELRIHHAHNRGITEDKLFVLPLMLQTPESVKFIADSASKDYRYFFGSDAWCVGVTLTNEQPVDPDADVYAPRTVRNVSISSRSIQQAGTVLYPLTGARVIPPR
ncbi:PBECR4 domain-containing protein [Bifidobacterium scaligerum]|uniref:PBECR4 domain-containing protein n=1 Tax=Bifidobacterium scaligerum TaxID=2052656 RepID=UPI0010554E58|nr:PBECR4 domain-containing protein [Bifidobacterium scaligerum]